MYADEKGEREARQWRRNCRTGETFIFKIRKKKFVLIAQGERKKDSQRRNETIVLKREAKNIRDIQ